MTRIVVDKLPVETWECPFSKGPGGRYAVMCGLIDGVCVAKMSRCIFLVELSEALEERGDRCE